MAVPTPCISLMYIDDGKFLRVLIVSNNFSETELRLVRSNTPRQHCKKQLKNQVISVKSSSQSASSVLCIKQSVSVFVLKSFI